MVHTVQGVSSWYDILLRPRWPSKFDFQVKKRYQYIWVVSVYFQKSKIGWPWQPLTKRMPKFKFNEMEHPVQCGPSTIYQVDSTSIYLYLLKTSLYTIAAISAPTGSNKLLTFSLSVQLEITALHMLTFFLIAVKVWLRPNERPWTTSGWF